MGKEKKYQIQQVEELDLQGYYRLLWMRLHYLCQSIMLPCDPAQKFSEKEKTENCTREDVVLFHKELLDKALGIKKDSINEVLGIIETGISKFNCAIAKETRRSVLALDRTYQSLTGFANHYDTQVQKAAESCEPAVKEDGDLIEYKICPGNFHFCTWFNDAFLEPVRILRDQLKAYCEKAKIQSVLALGDTDTSDSKNSKSTPTSESESKEKVIHEGQWEVNKEKGILDGLTTVQEYIEKFYELHDSRIENTPLKLEAIIRNSEQIETLNRRFGDIDKCYRLMITAMSGLLIIPMTVRNCRHLDIDPKIVLFNFLSIGGVYYRILQLESLNLYKNDWPQNKNISAFREASFSALDVSFDLLCKLTDNLFDSLVFLVRGKMPDEHLPPYCNFYEFPEIARTINVDSGIVSKWVPMLIEGINQYFDYESFPPLAIEKEINSLGVEIKLEFKSFLEHFADRIADYDCKLMQTPEDPEPEDSGEMPQKRKKSQVKENHDKSPAVRKLFHNIEIDIKTNPDKYKDAGKWLDEYCSIESFWQRRKEQLMKLEEELERDLNINDPEYKLTENCIERMRSRIEYLRLMITEKIYFPLKTIMQDSDAEHCHNFASIKAMQNEPMSASGLKRILDAERDFENGVNILYRFTEARDTLLPSYHSFLSSEDAKRICLMTWLSTDPDAGDCRAGISNFEQLPWDRRNWFAGYLFKERGWKQKQWLELLPLALGKIETEGKIQPIEKPQMLTRQERKILAEVAEEIRSNPEKFHAAGKLLDSFYNEKQYRQLKLKELAETKERDNYEGTETEYAEDYQQRLNGPLPPLSVRIEEAWNAFLLKFSIGPILEDTLVPLGRNESMAVLLIAWLISDSEAISLKLNLTNFERWPWSFIPTGSTDEDDAFYGMPRSSLLKSFIQHQRDEHGHNRLDMRKLAFSCVEYALDYAKNIKTSLEIVTSESPSVETEQVEHETNDLSPDMLIEIEVDLGDKKFNETRKGPYDFKEDMRTLADQRYIKYATKEEAIKAKKRIEGRLRNNYSNIKFKKLKGGKILRLIDGISLTIKK